MATAYKLPTICLPRRNLVLVRHCEIDGIHHDAVPRSLSGCGGRLHGVVWVQQPLVVTRIVLFVEARRQPKVRQFDVAVLVDEDIVRLDIAKDELVS